MTLSPFVCADPLTIKSCKLCSHTVGGFTMSHVLTEAFKVSFLKISTLAGVTVTIMTGEVGHARSER